MLDKGIKEANAREKLGLLPLKGKRRCGAQAENLEKERMELLDGTSAAAESSNRQRHSGSGGRAAAGPAPAEAAPAPGSESCALLEVQAKQKSRERGRQAVHDTDDATRGAGASRVGAAGAVEPEGQGGSPTTGSGAGVVKKGRFVSVADGRTLSRFNNLRKSFPNSYNSLCNPKLWNGQKLDLARGQAFKFACFVHCWPHMP